VARVSKTTPTYTLKVVSEPAAAGVGISVNQLKDFVAALDREGVPGDIPIQVADGKRISALVVEYLVQVPPSAPEAPEPEQPVQLVVPEPAPPEAAGICRSRRNGIRGPRCTLNVGHDGDHDWEEPAEKNPTCSSCGHSADTHRSHIGSAPGCDFCDCKSSRERVRIQAGLVAA
jgi:hypothetical protein